MNTEEETDMELITGSSPGELAGHLGDLWGGDDGEALLEGFGMEIIDTATVGVYVPIETNAFYEACARILGEVAS
jgi:hypothetical protein